MARGPRVALGLLVICGLLGTLAVYGLGRVKGIGPLADPAGCLVEVGGHRVTLSLEQARNAGRISALAGQRDLPARALTRALTVAYQQSDLLDVERDASGTKELFQQRPSDSAYADHGANARSLTAAFTGEAAGALWCQVADDAAQDSLALDGRGLVPRGAAVRAEIDEFFGLPLGGFEPRGVSSGHMRGSAHYEGRAVDAFVRPINAENKRRGWALAHYLVPQADRLAIRTVIFDDQIWRAGRGEWSDYRVPSTSRGDRKILEHRDHVHVDTAP